jgi:hypothetical protein
MEENFDLHEIILPSGRKATLLLPVPLSAEDKTHLVKAATGLIEVTIEAFTEPLVHRSDTPADRTPFDR